MIVLLAVITVFFASGSSANRNRVEGIIDGKCMELCKKDLENSDGADSNGEAQCKRFCAEKFEEWRKIYTKGKPCMKNCEEECDTKVCKQSCQKTCFSKSDLTKISEGRTKVLRMAKGFQQKPKGRGRKEGGRDRN